MKSYLRASKASGTQKRKVEILIRRGWKPGLKVGNVLSRKSRPEAAGGVDE